MREEGYSRAGYNSQQQHRSSSFIEGTRPRPDEVTSPRKGIIVKARQVVTKTGVARILVEIRFDRKSSDIQRGSYSRPFPLIHTVEEIAMLYGSLDDLIGLSVSVQTTAGRQDQGIATIINRSGVGDLNKANTLNPFGTLLAPAGSGGVI